MSWRVILKALKCLKHGWKFQSFMMNNKYETLLILTFTGNMCVRNQTKIMQRWPRQLPRLLDANSPQRVCPSVTVGGLIRGPAATRRLQLRWKSLNAFWFLMLCYNVMLYNLGLLWWSQKSLCLHQCWRSGVYRRLDRKQICRKISCINRGVCDLELYLNSIFAHIFLDMARRERFCGWR